MEGKRVHLPLSQADIDSLTAGETVLLSGDLYTARDAAHLRLMALLRADKPLPIPKGACVYYTGPCPAAVGEVIGPCGPTTSARMDGATPALLDYGVTGLIGKGPRSRAVLDALQGQAVYFAATGGAGMLLSRAVKRVEPVAFEDLGTEAIRKLTVEDFPVIVAADARGGNLYKM